MIYISGLLCLIMGLLAVALQRLYSAVPARELRRLAARDDPLARKLYRPVSYGASLRALLWVVALLGLGFGLFVVAAASPRLVNLAVIFGVVAATLVWLPSLRLSNQAAHIAAWAAPTVTWILGKTHPFFERLARVVRRARGLEPHSGLYEKEDLQDLLARQKQQVDNRVDPDDLERTLSALAMSDQDAASVVQPRSELRLIEAHESIGPVLLHELHASRQRTFLVYDGEPDNIVGSLSLADALTAKQGGHVADIIRSDVTYVSEDFSLVQVAAAMARAGQQLAVVVNRAAEMVGVISFEQLLQTLLSLEQVTATLPADDKESMAAYRSDGQVDEAQPTQAIESESADLPEQSSEAASVAEAEVIE